MARQFLVPVNLNKNELQNAVVQNLGTAPANPVAGQIYYDTATNVLYFWNGSEWVPTSGSTEVIQDVIGASIAGGTALTATYNDETGVTTIKLNDTAVSAGSYGSASSVATFTVDAQGRITAASNSSIQISTSQVTDLAEFVEDTVGDSVTGLLVEGEGINLTYDDPNGTLTISGEDASSSNKGIASFDAIDFTVTTGNVVLNAERVEDIVANLVVGGTGIDATYNDGSGSLTIDIDSTVTTNSGAQTLTNKTLGSNTALSANLNASNFKIENLATPTADSDAATKAYVDSVAEGLHIHASVAAATTANIADLSDPPATIDGVTLVDGIRILVKDQENAAQNGIYVYNLSTTALVRANDYNTAGEVDAGDFVFVAGGDTYNNTGWVQENPVTTLGTDPIAWTQFSGAGTYTAGAGLNLNGTVFSVDVTPSSGNASLTNTGGAVEVKVNTSDGLEVTSSGLGINNGDGLTFSGGGALTLDTANGYGVRKKAFNVGNGSNIAYTLNHNLGTRDVTVQVYTNASPYAQVEVDINHADSNNVTVEFATAPAENAYRVVIVG